MTPGRPASGERPPLLRAAILAASLLAQSWSAPAQTLDAPRLRPTGAVTVEGVFHTEDGAPPARDISGIACKPPDNSARRLCLVVNDQDRFAQLATMSDDRLVAGPTVPLLGDRPSAATIGAKPAGLACSAGERAFKDMDGEGVAYAAPYFYVAGSHGCSRRNVHRPSAYILARLRIDDEGRVVDSAGKPAAPEDALGLVETTHRLADALRAAETVGARFGKDLEGGGVNLEGLAVVGRILYAGLRAPSLDGRAFIVAADVDALFSREAPVAASVIPLALGRDVGVRDLASLPDGRLLVLAGPAQDQDMVAYALFVAEPRAGGSLTRLATLEAVGADCKPGPRDVAGKPEAVLPLEISADRLKVAILSDGLPNGAPCAYDVPLR